MIKQFVFVGLLFFSSFCFAIDIDFQKAVEHCRFQYLTSVDFDNTQLYEQSYFNYLDNYELLMQLMQTTDNHQFKLLIPLFIIVITGARVPLHWIEAPEYDVT